MTRSLRLCLSLLIVAASAACIAPGFAVPTTPPDTVGTIVAATMAAITPAPTETPLPPTPTLAPLILPTSSVPTQPIGAPTIIVVPAATRISFLTGATTGVVSGPIQPGQTINYVLQAAQGQPMMVDVGSLNSDVTLSIKTQGGTSMLNASAGRTSWQGSLPQTEDYYLSVHGGATTENFTMTVSIPSRIKFQEGADTAKVSGQTVAGYNVAYVLFALKGQKMRVELDGLSSTAALSIWGWNDGQPYVRAASEKSSFSFTLPATQDYIVQVVPQAGSTVRYVMVVKIQ